HDLGASLAGGRRAVWCRAAVVDAVAVLELVDVAAELELHRPGQDDEQLLRIAVGIGLGSRRAARIELSCERLEMLQRPRRQEQLPAEDPERERWTLGPPQHPRPRRAARLEQVRDRDAEGIRDAAERGDTGARAAALDLAQEALADARTVGNRLERRAPQRADVAEPLADVDFGTDVGRARRHPDLLRPRRRKTEATLWSR